MGCSTSTSAVMENEKRPVDLGTGSDLHEDCKSTGSEESTCCSSNSLSTSSSEQSSASTCPSDDADVHALKACVGYAAAGCSSHLQNSSFFAIVQNSCLKAKVQQALNEDGPGWRQQTSHITDASCVVVIFKRTSSAASPAESMVGRFMTALNKQQFCTLPISHGGAEHVIRDLLSRPVEEEVQCILPIFDGAGARGSIHRGSVEQGNRLTQVWTDDILSL